MFGICKFRIPLHRPTGRITLAEKIGQDAEGFGDRADLNLTPDEVVLINRVRTRCDKLVVILYSGRPLIITNILPQVDALVVAWLPGT